MARERILITVKTYPTLSRKHGETVCTAAIREDGSWVRIYPVPFRRLEESEQYRKFDWLECDLINSRTEPRPETRHPADMKQLNPVGHMGTESNWREGEHTFAGGLQAGEADGFRLGRGSAEWDPAKLAEMRNRSNQGELFAEEA